MGKPITDRDINDFEQTTNGALETEQMTPKQYRTVAFRLQKVSVIPQTLPLVPLFECTCKGYWHHSSCAHSRFVERVHNGPFAQPALVFSAAQECETQPAYGRPRRAVPGLRRQPRDATPSTLAIAK